MCILLDCGNTLIKVAIKHRLKETLRYFTHHDIDKCIDYILLSKGNDTIFYANVSSLDMPSLWHKFSLKTQRHYTIIEVKSKPYQSGVKNAYTQPELLGVDRWLSLIAGKYYYPEKNIAIISCGTAITVDILNKNGAHQGGIIFPGVTSLSHCLSLQTNNKNLAVNLDRLKIASMCKKTWAKNTNDAVTLGIVKILTATLNNYLIEIAQQYSNQILFVLTGGDAQILDSLLVSDNIIVESLVLKGLEIVASEN